MNFYLEIFDEFNKPNKKDVMVLKNRIKFLTENIDYTINIINEYRQSISISELLRLEWDRENHYYHVYDGENVVATFDCNQGISLYECTYTAVVEVMEGIKEYVDEQYERYLH